MLFVIIPFILDVSLHLSIYYVGVAAGVTHTQEFPFSRPSFCVLTLLSYREMVQPLFLSLVDREVEFCVPTKQWFSTFWA